MPIYGEFLGNKIGNTIIADSLEDAELATGLPCVDITELNIGSGYVLVDGNWIHPDDYQEPILTHE